MPKLELPITRDKFDEKLETFAYEGYYESGGVDNLTDELLDYTESLEKRVKELEEQYKNRPLSQAEIDSWNGMGK